MKKQILIDSIRNEMADFCHNDEAFSDDAYLEINTDDGSAQIIDEEDADASPYDCYPVMQLVEMGTDGHWIPDEDAIRSLIDEQ